jgi:hypothetical protein
MNKEEFAKTVAMEASAVRKALNNLMGIVKCNRERRLFHGVTRDRPDTACGCDKITQCETEFPCHHDSQFDLVCVAA